MDLQSFTDYYIDENILKHAKKLNYIITPSTGSNHISHKDCKKLKIKIKSIKKQKILNRYQHLLNLHFL